MARVQYGAIITNLKGSVGGFTFQTNSSGEIVRKRPTGKKNPTVLQTVVQSEFTDLLAAWQSLSLADKILWNDFAALHTKTNKFGEVKSLTGMNWFISINQNRLTMGLGTYSQPPTYALPSAPPAFTVTLTAGVLSVTFSPNFQPTGTDLFIWTTQPVSRVSQKLRNAYRLTKVETGDNYGTIDLTTAWETTHGLSWPPGADTSCYTIAILIQSCLQSSGICSAGTTNNGHYEDPITGIGFWEIGATFVIS